MSVLMVERATILPLGVRRTAPRADTFLSPSNLARDLIASTDLDHETLAERLREAGAPYVTTELVEVWAQGTGSMPLVIVAGILMIAGRRALDVLVDVAMRGES